MSLPTISAMASLLLIEPDNREKNRLNILSEGMLFRPHICWSLGDDLRRSRNPTVNRSPIRYFMQTARHMAMGGYPVRPYHDRLRALPH